MNNARNLAIILSERSIKRGWPPYGGKNFVLSLVAYELIDIRNPENLEIFFCPGSDVEGARPKREAYELVTKEALAQRSFPELTVFAGRRNDEPSCRLGDAAPWAQEAVLACAYEDGVVVGFADGSTRWCDRGDLGLGPDDPIVFGEASASPLLRKLSDL